MAISHSLALTMTKQFFSRILVPWLSSILGTLVKSSSSVKDLGMVVDNSLSGIPHFDRRCEHASSVCRISCGSKHGAVKASIHWKAHTNGTWTSKIKQISITAIYNRPSNQCINHIIPFKSSHGYLQIESRVRFPTRADLIGISGVVEDSTTKDVSLLETQVEIRSATPVVVATSVVDIAVSRSVATVVGLAKGTIWLVLARIVPSNPSKVS